MKIIQKLSALFLTATITLSITACSTLQTDGGGGASAGGEQTGSNSAAAPTGLEKLMSKYENDLLNDIKKNGLSSEIAPERVTGWNPDTIKYETPEIGGDAILSSASLDGVDVSLVAHNITHLPDGELDGSHHTEDCSRCLCAQNILLYLKDDVGRKTLSTQINGNVGHHRLSEECLFDDSTRIYKTEQDGETYYLLMQFAEYNNEKEALIATFYVLDMELYELGSAKDENGISGGGLWIIDISAPEGCRIGSWWQAYQASKDFEYKSGTTFYDPVYGYEITFDMKRGRAEVAYTNE